MPTAPGLRPYVDERRRYVAITVDPALMRAIKSVASSMSVSMASVQLYCATLGVNPLMRRLGRTELELPAYLNPMVQTETALTQLADEGERPSLTLVASDSTRAEKTKLSNVGFVASQEAHFAAAAKELHVAKSSLATWAVVQHLNVMLAERGVEPVALPKAVEDRLPSILREMAGLEPLPDSQETLEIPTSHRGRKEARLAS